MKIGDTVWVFNVNRRVYRKNAQGVGVGGPIWREHWQPQPITGETSRSWLLGQYGWSIKVPKKNPDPTKFAFSEAEIDQRSWCEANWHRMQPYLRTATYDQLRKVAEIIGYTSERREE